MRFLVTREFADWFSALSEKPISVAVVGGTSQDPEVAEIMRIAPNAIIDYYGIENTQLDRNFSFLDLNNSIYKEDQKYQLVLCSQVIEHIWNLENAFNTLFNMIEIDGYLWLNCPTSNIPHGSPYFYSAGYTHEFIAENLRRIGFSVIESQHLGSPRYYFMTHALRLWATESEHKNPITLYNFQPGTFLGVLRKFVMDLPGRFVSLFYSAKISNSLASATETLVLAQVKDSSHR